MYFIMLSLSSLYYPNDFIVFGREVIKRFSCSTQPSMKFSLLVNMKMPGLLELGLVCLYSDFDLFCSSRRSLNGGVVDLYTD